MRIWSPKPWNFPTFKSVNKPDNFLLWMMAKHYWSWLICQVCHSQTPRCGTKLNAYVISRLVGTSVLSVMYSTVHWARSMSWNRTNRTMYSVNKLGKPPQTECALYVVHFKPNGYVVLLDQTQIRASYYCVRLCNVGSTVNHNWHCEETKYNEFLLCKQENCHGFLLNTLI